jgi:hypothetical protein
MRNTDFAVTFDVAVNAYNRDWNLTCTASMKGWDCEPVILWLENNGETPWVPADVWDAVEAELATGGPARDAYDAAMAKADVPFMAQAAE